ncbi:hypothetical protein [Paenibacillus sp. J22TS3]|uniref:hypothetical protein n=1 Tax=Paenibacillus sp. J22TS3 TaxID=2807192 RepID=UPI001B194F51|nr:hypothetical protein [Paenibacillus sp. J22TS3]GIP21213.1 hypothetical protein J22TS3_14880 [Paenibacillus sp. J22TS3]
MDYSRIALFIVLAIALGLILIMNRDNIPPKLKRPMAISALVMIIVAFVLVIYSFLA